MPQLSSNFHLCDMFVKAHQQFIHDVYSRYTVSIVFLSSILNCLRLLFYTLFISVNSLDAVLYTFCDNALSNIQNKVELVLKRRNINLLDRRQRMRGPNRIQSLSSTKTKREHRVCLVMHETMTLNCVILCFFRTPNATRLLWHKV